MYSVTDSGVLKTVESWSVVIPLCDNSGKPFEKTAVDRILDEILLNYPGFSVTNSIGYWKGSAQVHIDENYQVLIDSVPDNDADSSKFFSSLKKELQTRLHQEKIYVTKQDSKQELLSFDEFFDEVGIEISASDIKEQASRVAKRMVKSIDFVVQRLGYETCVLRRDTDQKKIVWERKICGIKLRSEFVDTLPAKTQIVAADQFTELGRALAGEADFAILGGYEFQHYVVQRNNQRFLVEARNVTGSKYPNPYCHSPAGEPLSVKRFIEEFTMSIFTNCLILRDEGFLSTEIKVNVGGDGSCQWTQGALKTLLMRCPASIPDKEIQVEIIECLHSALQLYEENAADPIAILQAKAKNNYFLKRAIVRHTLRGTEETISP